MLRQVLVCGLLLLVPVSASARPHRLRAAEALLSEIEELVDDELLHSKVSGREHAFAGDEERSFWRKKKSNGDAVMMDNPMYEEDDADDEEAPDDAAATSADDEEDNELTDFKPDLINDVSSVSKIWMKSHKADGVEVVTINAGNCGVNFRKLSGVSVWGKGEGDHCKINQLVITATNKKNTQSEETDETLYKKLTDSHAFTLFKELFKAVPGATELTTLAEAANFFGHAESIKNVLDKTADQDWEFVLKKISSEAAKLGLSAITGGISETFLGVIDVAKAAKAWYTKNRDEKKEREEAELEQVRAARRHARPGSYMPSSTPTPPRLQPLPLLPRGSACYVRH